LHGSDPFIVLGAEEHDAGAQFPSFSGWLDERRFSTALRYGGAGFTPPSAPFAADASTAALLLTAGPSLGCSAPARPSPSIEGARACQLRRQRHPRLREAQPAVPARFYRSGARGPESRVLGAPSEAAEAARRSSARMRCGDEGFAARLPRAVAGTLRALSAPHVDLVRVSRTEAGAHVRPNPTPGEPELIKALSPERHPA
jgi:hypothetical protein